MAKNRRDATLAEQRENGDPAYIGYHSTHVWTWAEVVRQPIAGNVHLDLGSDWTGRMSQAAEERALRWAEAGVTRVLDIFKTEIRRNMALLGAARLDDLDSRFLK